MKHQLPLTSWNSNVTFELSPRLSSASGLRRVSQACAALLTQLKDRIAGEMSFRFADRLSTQRIRQAVNEADAIAASLPYPSLIFPALAEEKVLEAARWQARQRLVESRSLARAA
jgi:hypothetical protein